MELNTVKFQLQIYSTDFEHRFLDYSHALTFVLTSVIFLTEHSWGYMVLLYVFVQLSRVVVVGVLYPFLKYFGYGLDWREAIILVWSGLRGAVALALSLSVKASSSILPKSIRK